MENKKYTFVLDVDGVLTDGSFLYDSNGKAYKVFGPDDADALKALSKFVNIVFTSQDKRGFLISKKRVEDMGFTLENVGSKDRVNFMEENYGLENCIYMGDSFLDVPALCASEYGISTCASDPLAQQWSDYVTEREGGHRAVSEACFWIAKNILNLSTEEFLGFNADSIFEEYRKKRWDKDEESR